MTEGEKWVMARNHPSPETAFDAGVIEGKRQLLKYSRHLNSCYCTQYAILSKCDCGYRELITEIEKEKS